MSINETVINELPDSSHHNALFILVEKIDNNDYLVGALPLTKLADFVLSVESHKHVLELQGFHVPTYVVSDSLESIQSDVYQISRLADTYFQLFFVKPTKND